MLQEMQKSGIPAVFKHYGNVMYAAAYKVSGSSSDAENAVLDAFEKLIRSPDTLLRIPFEDLKAYLTIISRNCAYALLSKNALQAASTEDAEDFIFDTGCRPEDTMMEQLENIDIFNLPKMQDKYRDVLILLYYYDLPISKVAEALTLSEGDVKARVSRALEQLRLISGSECKLGVKGFETE